MNIRMVATGAAALALVSGWALAQSNPSEDQIINDLRPDAQSLRGPTRGIRPAGLPNPEHARVRQAGKPGSDEAPSVDLTVNFVSGSPELTPSARHTLDTLGRALISPPLASFRFRIEGHTDTVGNEADNQSLSEQRAQHVAAYLEEHYNISQSRFDTVGRGQTDLAVATPPQTAEARNRRVKVVNLGS